MVGGLGGGHRAGGHTLALATAKHRETSRRVDDQRQTHTIKLQLLASQRPAVWRFVKRGVP